MSEETFSLGSIWFEYIPKEQITRKGPVGATQINGDGEAHTIDEIKALKDWLEFVIRQEEGP